MLSKSKSTEMKEAHDFLEEAEGELIERKENFVFTVRLDDGRELDCHLSPSYYHHLTTLAMEKILPKAGERVWIEVSPFDADKGRILSRKGKWNKNA